ncbi:MAG: hypothetical protein ACK5O2_05690, partial [Microthrixaceae bacterium]
MSRRFVLVLGSLFLVAASLGIEGGANRTTVGVPEGIELAESDSLVVQRDGAVVDAMSVRGTIYVYGDDVTIRNSYVEAPAWYGIRVMDGSTGLRIEDTTVQCTGAQGWGVVFDNYTALRVAVNGCERAFAHLDRDGVNVIDSAVDGFKFEAMRAGPIEPGSRPAPATSSTTPVTSTSTTSVVPGVTSTTSTSVPSTTSTTQVPQSG